MVPQRALRNHCPRLPGGGHDCPSTGQNGALCPKCCWEGKRTGRQFGGLLRPDHLMPGRLETPRMWRGFLSSLSSVRKLTCTGQQEAPSVSAPVLRRRGSSRPAWKPPG